MQIGDFMDEPEKSSSAYHHVDRFIERIAGELLVQNSKSGTEKI